MSPETLKFKWQFSKYLELNPTCAEDIDYHENDLDQQLETTVFKRHDVIPNQHRVRHLYREPYNCYYEIYVWQSCFWIA